ncbi:MAG: glycerophosphodiester phosphodiesterase family protein [Bacillota bacterium]|nr:glycerophosphodiester phosphodiesterase family protein [Bacillota bacterium]
MTALYIVLIVAAIIIVLYFLAIMPRFGHQKERKQFSDVYYAHRGLHDNLTQAPENSLAAFKKAVAAGYGIELDVQLTKDKVPVVFHDFTLQRICGKEGKVCDYNWEELKKFKLCESEETIPRMEEVLKVVGGKVPLIIEYKVEWMDLSVCPIVDELLQNYKGVYCIESFNPLVLLWYRRYRNNVFRGQLSDAFIKTGEFKGLLYRILQNLLLNWMTKPDFIAYNHKHENMLSRRLCRSLYKNTAAAWTIKSQEELERARSQFDLFIFDSFIPDVK